MHKRESSKSGPKRKIIEITEEILIHRNLETLSIREITKAAKSNVASINYHFGSRQGLFNTISNRILNPLQEIRSNLLADLAKPTLQNCISNYIRAVIPSAETLEMHPETYVPLVGKFVLHNSGNGNPPPTSPSHTVDAEYMKAIKLLCPGLSSTALQNRWNFFTAGLNQSFITHNPTTELPFHDWEHFAVQGFLAEYPDPTPPTNNQQGMLFDF